MVFFSSPANLLNSYFPTGLNVLEAQWKTYHAGVLNRRKTMLVYPGYLLYCES